MHHKFLIVDQEFLLTGSFNWTVQAGKGNQENVLITDEQFYIQKYHEEFENLWEQFKDNEVKRDRSKQAKHGLKEFQDKIEERKSRQKRKE